MSQVLTTTDASITTLTADVADESGFRSTLDVAYERLGTPDLVVYNAAIVQPDRVGELSAQDHMDAWAVNVVGALTTAAHLVPSMAVRGSGTFIVTGGMPEAKPDYASLSLGKAGLRTAVDLLQSSSRAPAYTSRQ